MLSSVGRPSRCPETRATEKRDREAAAHRILEATVAAALRVPPELLRRPTRGRAEVAFARQVAMYIGHVWLGLSMAAVGRMFRRDRTTVAHACRVVEERRDDPKFDRILNCLESAVAQWARFGARGEGAAE
jgi:chromosomal replication initiation ATPase DnaA